MDVLAMQQNISGTEGERNSEKTVGDTFCEDITFKFESHSERAKRRERKIMKFGGGGGGGGVAPGGIW